jgi:hypothetical protein
MSKKSKIGIWLSIGFVAIFIIIGGYAMFDGLPKGTLVIFQPQNTAGKRIIGKEHPR